MTRIALLQAGIVAGALAATAIRVFPLRRRGEAYSLSDAIGSGMVGGVLGSVAAAVMHMLREDAAGSASAALSRMARFGGLALIEGAIVGTALAFLIAWLDRRRARPPG